MWPHKSKFIPGWPLKYQPTGFRLSYLARWAKRGGLPFALEPGGGHLSRRGRRRERGRFREQKLQAGN